MPFAILYMPSLAVIPVPWHLAERLPGALGKAAAEGLRTDRSFTAMTPMILLIWSIGALGLLIREGLANVGLIRWIRRARPLASVQWAATLDRVSNELGIKRPLRVLESPHVTSPCTWGFLRPVLLLPVAGAHWPESQRRHALLHELAHIRRFDYLSSLVSRLVCAVHWYNPLVWFAATQVQKLQERACDDAVLSGGGTPSDYAQFLLSIADKVDGAPGPFRIAMGMTRRSLLHARLIAILDPHKARRQTGWLGALVALLPLSCLTVVLASTVAATASDEPEERPAVRLPEEARSPLDPVEPLQPLEPLEPLEPIPPPEPVEALPPLPAVPVVPAIPAVPAVPPSTAQSAV